jgi:hypothetical protein
MVKGGPELVSIERIMNPNEGLTLAPTATGKAVLLILVMCLIAQFHYAFSFAPTACLIASGYSSPCIASSSAPTGTISVTFTAAAQTVAVTISPSKRFYTRVKFTCNTLTDVAGYTVSLLSCQIVHSSSHIRLFCCCRRKPPNWQQRALRK